MKTYYINATVVEDWPKWSYKVYGFKVNAESLETLDTRKVAWDARRYLESHRLAFYESKVEVFVSAEPSPGVEYKLTL